MKESNIPFQTIDWEKTEKVRYPGETGYALWRTMQYPGLRVRIVDYSEGYVADHWCKKGHIVHVLEGTLVTEHKDGISQTLERGMTYIVSDELSEHRSVASESVKLLIIDGDFLG